MLCSLIHVSTLLFNSFLFNCMNNCDIWTKTIDKAFYFQNHRLMKFLICLNNLCEIFILSFYKTIKSLSISKYTRRTLFFQMYVHTFIVNILFPILFTFFCVRIKEVKSVSWCPILRLLLTHMRIIIICIFYRMFKEFKMLTKV